MQSINMFIQVEISKSLSSFLSFPFIKDLIIIIYHLSAADPETITASICQSSQSKNKQTNQLTNKNRCEVKKGGASRVKVQISQLEFKAFIVTFGQRFSDFSL